MTQALQQKLAEVDRVLQREQVADLRASFDVELERIEPTVRPTEAQRQAAMHLREECVRLFAQDDDEVKAEREFLRRIDGLYTSEQRARLSAFREEEGRQQAEESTRWTMALLAQACDLTVDQHARIASKLQDYYGQQWKASFDPNTPVFDSEQLKETLARELSPNQLSRFDEWFDTRMDSSVQWGPVSRPSAGGPAGYEWSVPDR